jgi:hypothetical protein
VEFQHDAHAILAASKLHGTFVMLMLVMMVVMMILIL